MAKKVVVIKKLFEDYGEVRNVPSVIKSIIELPDFEQYNELSTADVITKLNKLKLKNERFFTQDFLEVERDTPTTNPYYMWVEFEGLKNEKGYPVYIQFCKCGLSWVGALVGIEGYLLGHARATNKSDLEICYRPLDKYKREVKQPEKVHAEKVRVEKGTEIHSTCIQGAYDAYEFYRQLQRELLIPTQFSLDDLRFYVSGCAARISCQLAKGKDMSENLLVSDDGKSCIFNTGLIDVHGNQISVISSIKNNIIESENMRICLSVTSAIKAGFDKDKAKRGVQPVKFYDSKEDLIFDSDLDDFDFEDISRLRHICRDRVSRFPEEMQTMSMTALATDVKRCVEIAVKISKVDTRYIRPIYNRDLDQMNFVVPYHPCGDFSKPATCGIVIARYDSGLWELMTILDEKQYRDAVFFGSLYESMK